MEIAVSELIVRFLERLGVETVFGIPGAHILPVYDGLYGSAIKTVLAKHEQGAAFMACGLARATGGIGACIATAGPGATNLVTGIANAYADRLPLLAITGEAPTPIFGKGGLQESSGEGGSIDQAALFGGISRYHRIVERTDYLVHVLNRTAKILCAPNPGPVVLSIPFNVQKEKVEESLLDLIRTDGLNRASGDPRAVEMLAELLRASRHPVIVAGHGCLGEKARDGVARLSTALGIPVATTLKGKGVIGDDTELALGCLGVTSDGHAFRYLVDHADLVLVLGASFNERTSYVWDERLLEGKVVAQVDNDPEQLEKVFRADIAIRGDIDLVLGALQKHLAGVPPRSLERFAAHRAMGKPPPAKADFQLLRAFFAGLERRFPADLMVFDDNIVFAQNYFRVSRENSYFPNSGISSLGHAIPAAIGARLALDKPTFAILGDGGFQMCGMELMTAVNYRLPLNVVVFNNGTMGLVRKNQAQLYSERYIGCDFANPDFALLAQSFGIEHWRVAGETDVDELFSDCDFEGTINLIEIILDRDTFPDYLSGR